MSPLITSIARLCFDDGIQVYARCQPEAVPISLTNVIFSVVDRFAEALMETCYQIDPNCVCKRSSRHDLSATLRNVSGIERRRWCRSCVGYVSFFQDGPKREKNCSFVKKSKVKLFICISHRDYFTLEFPPPIKNRELLEEQQNRCPLSRGFISLEDISLSIRR